MPVEWVIPHFELADRELIDQIHAGREESHALDGESCGADAAGSAEWGVDAIISDETEMMIRTMR